MEVVGLALVVEEFKFYNPLKNKLVGALYLLESFSAGFRGVQSKERGNQGAAFATACPCTFQVLPFRTAQSHLSPPAPFLAALRLHHKSNIRAVRLITGWCMISPGKQ